MEEVRGDNCVEWMQVCLRLEVIDLCVWNSLLTKALLDFKDFSRQRRR